MESGSRIVEMAASFGHTCIRAFVDVDTIAGLRPVEAALEVKKKYADVMDIRVCAFPQEAILRDPGTEDLLVRAMEMGADDVGGLPWTRVVRREHAQSTSTSCSTSPTGSGGTFTCLSDNNNGPDVAKEHRISGGQSHPGRFRRPGHGGPRRGPLRLRRRSRHKGHSHDSRGGHPYRFQSAHQPERARPFERRSRFLRGLTRVKELSEAGVPVSCGQDDVMDPFYNFGKMDQLEVGLFMAHAVHLTSSAELETVYDMIGGQRGPRDGRR